MRVLVICLLVYGGIPTVFLTLGTLVGVLFPPSDEWMGAHYGVHGKGLAPKNPPPPAAVPPPGWHR